MINISGYRIDDVIYDGLKTLIYKGYKESNSQYFVIKTLKSEYNSSKNRLKLKHEYEISKDLNIKGIIKAQDILTHNNNVYLVLDNFEGISLKKLLESQSIPIDLCLEIMIALLSSVAELHYYKLIHKDLKPSNILLNLSDKQVKITDFGISSLFLKENKDMVSPNLLEGSLPYLSPEQTGRINRQIDFRSDIYSLGITFYELLTRQKPFQGKDPLEWIFCHISKTPVSPNEINSEIPITLSNIIMKCLKKLPEERYQSVFCLKTDLEECLKQLNTKNSIDPFHIAVNDIPQHLHISQKLYGRTKEKDLLINALNRIHNGKPELVLISGYSGTGKTSIVKEIYKSITEKNAYYTNGKYDQYNRNPYGAIIQAFRKLINQILINDENKLTYWKNVILEALNPNTQLLIDFIPELIYIVGSQPELPLVEPKEAESRFIFTIIKFIKIFAKKENTLVIFLDDLQWIDLPSLKLIESVLLDKEEKYFLLMGAYRDNEVNDTHPLKNIIQELIKSQIIIQSIYLNPLTMDESNELISDTFYSSKENTISIAELVYRKTKGNPFFINQFLELLYEDGHILFDSVKGSWTWTIPKITSRELTDDIAIFMKQRIDQLPEKCKYILQIASLFGNRFEISILSEILEQSVMESVTDIELAIQESFIIGLQDEINYDNISRDGDDKELTSYNAYKFSHDQIQQVFYTSIPEEKRKEIHLMLGLKLLKMYEDCESDYYLFNTVNNLNIVAKYISHSDVPLLKLAKLNLMAGKKAKEFIAFDSALNYFSMGISFLAEHSWDTDYDLTLEIYLEKAESEFLNIHYEKAEQLYDYILTK
ncbi:MAG: AAA family ATPase, partial [Spirochaetota bacterium]|nr:AAA family ATPase [Spirochaetota bacterium]